MTAESDDGDIDTVDVETNAWARRILIGAIVAEFVLLVLDYVFNFFDVANDVSIRRIFNIAREQSVPTFFASIQALAVGLTGLALWRLQRRQTNKGGGWLVVAVFWIYVAFDDNAEIHERVGSALERASEGTGLVSNFPSFAWQIFLAPLLAAGLAAAVVVVWRHASKGRLLLLVCLGCFAVAQGFDFLEGIDGLFEQWATNVSLADYTVSHGFRATEEMLEMLGTTAFWAPTLWLLAERVKSIRATIS